MATKGNCYLCGAELGKTAIKNHILKHHNPEGEGQECRLLKIEGAYDKDYWLYADIPVDKSLSACWPETCRPGSNAGTAALPPYWSVPFVYARGRIPSSAPGVPKNMSMKKCCCL